MGEAAHLLLHRLHDLRMAVAGVEHGDATGKIDVALAFHVPDFGVVAAVDEDLVGVAHAARNGRFAARVQAGVGGLGGVEHGFLLR